MNANYLPGMFPSVREARLVFACACGQTLDVAMEGSDQVVRCPSCGRSTRLSSPPSSGNFGVVTPERGLFSASSEETLPPPAKGRVAINEMTSFLAPAQEAGELGRLGQYRILQVLGQGGMGVVFLAEDPHLRRRVAVKAMLPHLAAHPSARERFLREACLAAALDHDHIVAIHHIGEDRGVPYIVMPLLRGESLDTRLKGGRPVPTSLIVQVGLEVADALVAAHEEGLLHRDIKPANIWLEQRSETAVGGAKVPEDKPYSLTALRVKVLDFGLARPADEAPQHNLTLSGAVLGTPGYMPPEQIDGEVLDGRADVFSLGCILYGLATGKAAFPGDSVSARLKSVILHDPPDPSLLNPALPPALSALILQMLAKNKDDRPSSAQEVRARLREIRNLLPEARGDHQRAVSGTPSHRKMEGSRASYRRWRTLFVGTVLGALAVVLVTGLLRDPQPSHNKGGAKSADDPKTGWMGWPLDAPAPALAPFDASQAKSHQEAWAKYLGVPVEWTNSLGMKFRLLPPGEFMMGAPRQEIDETIAQAPNFQSWHAHFRSEGPQHRVILTKPVYVAVTEVTQKEFQQIMGENPSSFAPKGRRKESVAKRDTSGFPVDSVDWLESMAFTIRLSEKEKLRPRYFRGSGTVTLLQGDGYRLPTEAEWEFACRAGTTGRYWFGDSDQELNQAAWFRDNSGDRTHPVGELRANPFGLFDMYGNVWEWCQDWYDATTYSQPSVIDPLGPSGGSDRVLRGGGWSTLLYARSAARHPSVPFSNGLEPGFRVVLPVDTVRDLLKKTSKTPTSGPG